MTNTYLTIPNFITCIRLLGTAALPFTTVSSVEFYVIYTICGVSDVLDGWLARILKQSSEFGSRLDSVADLLFYFVMLLMVFPVLWAKLPWQIWIAVGAVILLRLVSYTVAAVKYKRFASVHTYANKLTGLLMFSVPYFLPLCFMVAGCFVVCIATALSSLEEFLIHILSKEYNSNVKSIFMLPKAAK
ncbi:MAG: CDP-alcohol phosphatidyltransferase family protein [Clostridia bacterium]|nr:CDP-alcohol phosphatidyltransferase family protein [Clostridia bacterium]